MLVIGGRKLKSKLKNAIYIILALIICWEVVNLLGVFYKKREIATKNITGTSTHEHSQETVYEDNNVICVEVRDDWSDPKAPHPITEVVHHTYDKETNKELTLLDVTGMSSEELAKEIKGMLKEGYPELYERFWGNEDESYGFYAECFEKINPATLDFCISEDGKIEVYDQWGLDYATNPNGLLVYVTLKESVIYGI